MWQSRILGSGIGFVIAATGWSIVLWLCAPIYGAVLFEEFFQPIFATLGTQSQAACIATSNRKFVVTLITIALAGHLRLGRHGGLASSRSRTSTAACSASWSWSSCS